MEYTIQHNTTKRYLVVTPHGAHGETPRVDDATKWVTPVIAHAWHDALDDFAGCWSVVPVPVS